jgi:hypothetical protein
MGAERKVPAYLFHLVVVEFALLEGHKPAALWAFS